MYLESHSKVFTEKQLGRSLFKDYIDTKIKIENLIGLFGLEMKYIE